MINKSLKFSLLVIVIVGGIFLASCSENTDEKILEYTINEDEAVVTGASMDATTIVIPRTVIIDKKNYPVTSIANYAFSYCTHLKSVRIPDSIIKVGESIFSYCRSLTIYCEAKSIPSGWSTNWDWYYRPVYWGINDTNYYNDGELEYVVKDNKAVVTRASNDVSSIVIPKTITINENNYPVTSIGSLAFSYCEMLESVTICENIEKIEDYAFSSCSSLTIKCEAKSIPSGWSFNWNPSNRKVEWGKQN